MLRAPKADLSARAEALLADGFLHVRDRHPSKSAAWAAAREAFAAASQRDSLGSGMQPLEVVGEFTVPPPGAPQRAFQVLHLDFGLPIEGCEPVDVARFTALHIDAGHPPTTARTRVVPLRSLLGQRAWGGAETLAARLRRYGSRNDADARYVEGILARLVEAADACADLPSTAAPDFLCGMEFAALAEEQAHFAQHGLDLEPVEVRIPLAAGELLLIDNLATAHGRLGTRSPEELHQLCVGYRGLDVAEQRRLLPRVLGAFAAGDDGSPAPTASRR